MNKTLKIGLLIVSVLATAILGWQLFELAAKQQLWGHLPFFTLLSGWIAILLLWEKRFSKHPNKHKMMGAALLSGVLLAIGFPPISLSLTLFVGFLPLLWIEQEITNASLKKSSIEIFKYSYITFVTWNLLATWWVANASFISVLIAIGLNSLFMTIPFVGYHRIKERFTAPNVFFAFAGFWLAYEYLHARWDLSWPWLTLGNGFAEYPIFVQWYDITGAQGGSLWVLAANFYLFSAYNAYQTDRQTWKKKLILPLLILFLPMGWSMVKYFSYNTNTIAKVQTIDVMVVQPNHEPHYEKRSRSDRMILEKTLGLALDKIDEQTQYLVLPETTFGSVWHESIGERDIVEQLQEATKQFPNLKIITGLTSFEKLEDIDNLPTTARAYPNKEQPQFYYNAYNSAVQIAQNQTNYPIHIKGKQVPGAELMPFPWLLGMFESVFESFGGTTAGLGMPKETVVFSTGENTPTVGTAICYESVYGEHLTRQVQKGATALFIITNDGWWGNTAGHKQHLHYASLRAIETRRAIARSANTGISCFIDARGNIRQATTYEEDAVIKDKLVINEKLTFYTRYGDLVGRVAGFITIMLSLSSISRRFTDKKTIGK